ncbi:hypothetical protein AB0C65_32880 [Nocardia sp. NPDC048505]|uniref:hypothetical protein n=1 Tax=Nocardia sp. NPDC048505 TaxID=3155756 RepID=UPI0033E94F4F
MRDFMGAHVSRVSKHGYQDDVDGVYATNTVRGSFRVHYADNIDQLVVSVTAQAGDEMRMHLSLGQAILLRDLLDAGIADMKASTTATMLELPSGGAA